jgi:hypothetical protein
MEKSQLELLKEEKSKEKKRVRCQNRKINRVNLRFACGY